MSRIGDRGEARITVRVATLLPTEILVSSNLVFVPSTPAVRGDAPGQGSTTKTARKNRLPLNPSSDNAADHRLRRHAHLCVIKPFTHNHILWGLGAAAAILAQRSRLDHAEIAVLSAEYAIAPTLLTCLYLSSSQALHLSALPPRLPCACLPLRSPFQPCAHQSAALLVRPGFGFHDAQNRSEHTGRQAEGPQ